MDRYAKKRLREGLKKHGLVEPIVWNERTGNIIGGHQRVEQLDALEKSPDYSLTVAVVNVGDAEEKELNVALNNPHLQGSYDHGMLEEVLGAIAAEGGDVLGTGFDKSDIAMLCDAGVVDELFGEQQELEAPIVAELEAMRDAGNAEKKAQDGQQPLPPPDGEPAGEGEPGSPAGEGEPGSPAGDGEWTPERMANRRKEYLGYTSGEDSAGFYIVLVFTTDGEVRRFLNGLDLPVTERYLAGPKIAERMGIQVES